MSTRTTNSTATSAAKKLLPNQSEAIDDQSVIANPDESPLAALSRLNLVLDPRTEATLKRLSKSRHARKADVIRRALAAYDFLCDEADSNGPIINVNDKKLILP